VMYTPNSLGIAPVHKIVFRAFATHHLSPLGSASVKRLRPVVVDPEDIPGGLGLVVYG
jgi:hypothetical protein